MPKVKEESSAIHPNSRKAFQFSRQQSRNAKLEKRRIELNLKQKAKMKKLKWLKENVDAEKKMLTAKEFQELIEKYFDRFSDKTVKLEEAEVFKNRDLHERISHEYKTKFLIEKEKHDFETGGIDMPDLLDAGIFKNLMKWNRKARYLPSFQFVPVTKRSLERLTNQQLTKDHQKISVNS